MLHDQKTKSQVEEEMKESEEDGVNQNHPREVKGLKGRSFLS